MLHHVLLPPRRPSPGPPPLLVLLHGVGADEEDLLPIARDLDPGLAVLSLRAPYEARPMGYAWYALDWRTSPPTPDLAQFEASRATLAAELPALVAAAGADPRRVFLFGFSQGAAMSLELLLDRPKDLRGVILHSGRAMPGAAGRAAASDLRAAEVLILHGTQDDVLPVQRGREVRDLLAPHLGNRLAWAEHEAGHFVTAATLRDANAFLAARLGPA